MSMETSLEFKHLQRSFVVYNEHLYAINDEEIYRGAKVYCCSCKAYLIIKSGFYQLGRTRHEEHAPAIRELPNELCDSLNREDDQYYKITFPEMCNIAMQISFDSETYVVLNSNVYRKETYNRYACIKCKKSHFYMDVEEPVLHGTNELLHYPMHGPSVTKVTIYKNRYQRDIGQKKLKATQKTVTDDAVQEKEEDQEKEKRIYQCHCGNIYAKRYLLTVHQRKHTEGPTYVCNNCGKRFWELKDLKRHLVTHSEERNFLCDLCHMTFKRSDHLRRHQRHCSSDSP